MNDPFSDFNSPASKPAPRVARPPSNLELWVVWTCLVLVGCLIWLAGRPGLQWPRTLAMLTPLVVFTAAGLIGVFRGANGRFVLGLVLGALLIWLAWWYMPTADGLTYAAAHQQVLEVGAAVADRDEFWQRYQAAQLALLQFPELKSTFAFRQQDWARQRVDVSVRACEQQLQKDPRKALAQLSELEADLQRLNVPHSDLMHMASPLKTFSDIRERCQRAWLQQAAEEVQQLAREQKWDDLQKLLSEVRQLTDRRWAHEGPEWEQFWKIAGSAVVAPELAQIRGLLKEDKITAACAVLRQMARKVKDFPNPDAATQFRDIRNEIWRTQYLALEQRVLKARTENHPKKLEQVLPALLTAWGEGDVVFQDGIQSQRVARGVEDLERPPLSAWPEWRELVRSCAVGAVDLDTAAAETLLKKKQFLAARQRLEQRTLQEFPLRAAPDQANRVQAVRGKISAARQEAARVEFARWIQQDNYQEIAALLRDLEDNWTEADLPLEVSQAGAALRSSLQFWLQVSAAARQTKQP